MAKKPQEVLKVELKTFDKVGVKKSPALEYTFAWLKKNAPKSATPEDAPEWWQILESSRRVTSSMADAASVRAGDLSLDRQRQETLRAEWACLEGIAVKSKGSVQAALAENVEDEEEPKKRRSNGDEDDEDEDEDKPSGSLAPVEQMEALQRFLFEKLGDEHNVAKTAAAHFDALIRLTHNGPALEKAEAISLCRLLGHPLSYNCWKCGAVCGSDLSGLDVVKLRSELCNLLREGRTSVSKVGLLKHLLVTSEQKLQFETASPLSKL